MNNDMLYSCKAFFAPNAHTELRMQTNRQRRVSMLKGNLVGNARTKSSGVCARVYKNGVWGFSSLAETSEEAAKRVLKAAADNALFLDSRTGYNKPDIPPVQYGRVERFDGIKDAEQKVYVEYLAELDKYIEASCKGLVSRTVMAMEDSMEKLLVSSDGAEGHTAIPRSYVYVALTAEHKSGVPVELFVPFGGLGTFEQNFSSAQALYAEVDSLYEQLMQKAEGVHADAGEKLCILGGEMTGMLSHEAVGHTVEADLVLAGSVAARELGNYVASPLVSLTDFAHTAFGKAAPLPVYMDDEGVIAEDAPIIKDGVLVGYMNNRESARHFGVKPCGNARAFGYSDEPLVRMRNTAIHPGESSLEEMIASVDDGYYLISSNNGQADTTGEFMFGVCMGYEIKKGKLGKAILDTTISGVAFNMLKTVDMVGNDVTWVSSGMCGKKQPMPVGMGGPALRCRVMMGGR